MNDAPFSRRFAALFLDLIIVASLLCGIVYLLEYYSIFSITVRFSRGESTAYLQVYVFYICFYFIYELLSTLLLRATPGKILANIETEFPGELFIARSILRSFLKTLTIALAPIGIPVSLIFGLSQSSGVVHDAICKSQVTNETRCPRLFGILIFALSVSCFIVFYLHFQVYFFDFRSLKMPTLY
ncbi:MAG: RDD family protein [Clostridiaceae bacterium]|nr:RDD family protein [Clostridiaceae bacterium]